MINGIRGYDAMPENKMRIVGSVLVKLEIEVINFSLNFVIFPLWWDEPDWLQGQGRQSWGKFEIHYLDEGVFSEAQLSPSDERNSRTMHSQHLHQAGTLYYYQSLGSPDIFLIIEYNE